MILRIRAWGIQLGAASNRIRAIATTHTSYKSRNYNLDPVMTGLRALNLYNPSCNVATQVEHTATQCALLLDNDSLQTAMESLRGGPYITNVIRALAGHNADPANAINDALAINHIPVICGVPVDSRPMAFEIFRAWAEEAEDTFSSGSEEFRRPLLCNAASTGAGKTVLLAFDMLWFKQYLGGMALYVTFNDDQDILTSPSELPRTTVEFDSHMALRVIARALNANFNLIDGHSEAILTHLDSVASQDVSLPRLHVALAVARRVAGAPEDTKVLLAVDELSKYYASPFVDVDVSSNEVAGLIRLLCALYDDDPRVFLAVSAYGALDVARFATGSGRKVFFQPTPVIFPVPLHWSKAELESEGELGSATKHRDPMAALPPVLRVLSAPRSAAVLDRDDPDGQARAAMVTLTRILMATGGNPDAVSVVYNTLRRIPCGMPSETAIDDATVQAALKHLNTALANGLEERCWFRSRFKFSMIKMADLESVAQNTARAFVFESAPSFGRDHMATMRNSVNGCCHVVFPKINTGFAFVPYPVLQLCFENRLGGTSLRDMPCADALGIVYRALFEYCIAPGVVIDATQGGVASVTKAAERDKAQAEREKKSAKALESLALGSFLLFVRANNDCCWPLFQKTCQVSGRGSNVLRVARGAVARWDDIDVFPPFRDVSQAAEARQWGLQDVVDRLVELSTDGGAAETATAGVMFMPRHEKNPGADVFGLFRHYRKTAEYSLVAVQCKDQYLDKRDRLLKEWRANQAQLLTLATGRGVVCECDEAKAGVPMKFTVPLSGRPGRATVHVHYVLFSSNPVSTDGLMLDRNEHVVDLDHLSTWLPTAGLNARAIYRLREAFQLH